MIRRVVVPVVLGFMLGIGADPSMGQTDPSHLYKQLGQAVAEQNWQMAIDIVKQLKLNYPERQQELNAYQDQLEKFLSASGHSSQQKLSDIPFFIDRIPPVFLPLFRVAVQ